MPRVSIILPVHNGEKTIKRSLSSLAAQTYRDFETVLVNNNCTDKTLEIANEFKDLANLRIVDCKPKGLVCALNTGIQKSDSPLIARQDDDDCWYPSKLEKQVKYLDDNPEVGVVGTQIRLLDESGNIEDIGTYGKQVKYPTDDNNIKKMMLIGQNPLCHPSVVIRRDAILHVGGYCDHFHLAEDLDLWVRMMPWTKFGNLNEVLVDYTQTIRTDYNPEVPLLIADIYYNLYKRFGIVQGERPKMMYQWQLDKMNENKNV